MLSLLRMSVLVHEVSFQVVSSREAVLCTINCMEAITVGAVEATTIVLRLVSDEILLARECDSSDEARWFKTTMKLVVVLSMFAKYR
jgi:hypothetical protein